VDEGNKASEFRPCDNASRTLIGFGFDFFDLASVFLKDGVHLPPWRRTPPIPRKAGSWVFLSAVTAEFIGGGNISLAFDAGNFFGCAHDGVV